MRTTKQDLEMFRSLGSSEMGKWLLDYSRRVQDFAHDSRSWEGDDSKESAAQTSRLIENLYIAKIRPKTDTKSIVESEFE